MNELALETPAHERFATDVLAWGRPRPPADLELAGELRSELDRAVAAERAALERAAAQRRGRGVSIGRRVLERAVCDGWQLEPAPFVENVATVRSSLARDAIALDWQGRRDVPSERLVEGVWHEAATRSPGDPSSRSAWMNRRSDDEVAALKGEIVALLDDHREVWPQLPTTSLTCTVQRRIEVPLGGGLVTLFGVPDLVVDSRAQDDRARALVVDLRTGVPRPLRDREALRFHALLVTLQRGRPPFRWVSHHVAEGRSEVEGPNPDVLRGTADAVVAVVIQLARLAAGRPEQLTAGDWCTDCRRLDRCDVAAAAREAAAPAVSHPPGTIGA